MSSQNYAPPREFKGEGLIKNAVIGLMGAFSIPISAFPLWFPKAKQHRKAYQPFFRPWVVDEQFRSVWAGLAPYSTSRIHTAHNLWCLAKQAATIDGEYWEMGVYKGATARLIWHALQTRGAKKTLRLFDTFEGIPEQTAELDGIKVGDLADTSLKEVQDRLSGTGAQFHPGFIPDTFKGLEDRRIAFAHVDVDQYKSVLECCKFVYPRLRAGAVLVFDDYGKPGTPGALAAADEFFADKPEVLLVSETGQSLTYKLRDTMP